MQVKIIRNGENVSKVEAIKAIRVITGLELKDAKDCFDKSESSLGYTFDFCELFQFKKTHSEMVEHLHTLQNNLRGTGYKIDFAVESTKEKFSEIVSHYDPFLV